jgi:thiol-disulfide isomerase/thioredoxin
MRNKKNPLLVFALVIGLLSIALGCERSAPAASSEAKTPKTADASSGGAALPSLGPAPDVSFQTLSGKTDGLAQYRGKVVLLNFWATWCEPCKTEIPELIQLQNKYGNQGFTVLGVAMDQEGKSVVAPFVAQPQFQVGLKKVAMNYPIVLGNEAVETKFGGFIGFPTSFLIAKNGQIVKKVIGMIDMQSMSSLIQKLLSGNARVSAVRPASATAAGKLG